MRRFYPTLFILIAEVIVYYYTLSLTDDQDILYSLRARYSARISFFLLCTIGSWIVSLGLYNIFTNGLKRNLLIGGITAFTINHLIHYYFLYQNFEVSGMDISSKYISFGALGYIILTIAPIVIWKWNKLTQLRFYTINVFLILMIGICIFTYSSRFGKVLPMSTPMWMFKAMIGLGAIIILLMIGRLIKDRKTLKHEMA